MRFFLFVGFIFFTFSIWSIENFKTAMLLKNSLSNYQMQQLEIFEKIYKANNYENSSTTKKLRIPKIIHQIWIGSEVPQKYKSFMKTWKEKHPEWTYMLWTDNDIENFPFINKKSFDDAKNFGLKSDIWRLEILFLYGGLYVDTDFECLKPLDILHYSHDFYGGLLEEIIPNGIIGSVPNHPILHECIKALQKTKITPKSNPMSVSGPYFITKIIVEYLKHHPSENICFYPTSFFFPFPAILRHKYWEGKIPRNVLERFFKEESFAVHLWATSWQY